MEHLFDFLATIRWQDVVDVTLNSYILFRLYVLLRRTNVFHLLVGIAALWFLQRISVSLGLIVTSWVIQGITAAAALIIIVVFGSEIRSVFQTKSIADILWRIPKETAVSSVEIISEAVFDMAKKHCGSLIVIPGKDSLEGDVQNGIPWRGLLSREMIISIFWHNNPVHDGAAIIQGDQVTDVGVILPLSQRTDLPKHYGTRHRAALGLSEDTDALVIVSSEERGVVMVAKRGTGQVMANRQALEGTLRNHLGAPSQVKHFFGMESQRVASGALASLLFIGMIWFVLTRGFDPLLITMDIPVEYVDRDPGQIILNTSTNTVRLHLSGSHILLRSMDPDQVRVRVSLSDASVGENVIPITEENVTLPPGVLLSKVDPRLVELEIDVPVTRSLPVQVDWTGKLREDLILSDVKVAPSQVQVRGSAEEMDDIDTIYTEKIPLDRIEKSGRTTAGLVLGREHMSVPEGSGSVTVEYTVTKRE